MTSNKSRSSAENRYRRDGDVLPRVAGGDHSRKHPMNRQSSCQETPPPDRDSQENVSKYFDKRPFRMEHTCISLHVPDGLHSTFVNRKEWWDALQRTQLSSSQIAPLLNLSRFDRHEYAAKRLVEKMHQKKRDARFQAKLWGMECEPLVRQFLRDAFRINVIEVSSFIHPEDARLSAKPDGICKDAIVGRTYTVLEIKCPSLPSGSHQKKNDNLRNNKGRSIDFYMEYALQMYAEMACTGLKDALCIIWSPDRFALYHLSYEADLWDLHIYPALDRTLQHLEKNGAQNFSPQWDSRVNKEVRQRIARSLKLIVSYDKLQQPALLWRHKYLLVHKDVHL